MKFRFVLALLYVLSLLPLVSDAQAGLQNGGMEFWRRRQFRCCGRNVDTPADWGIPEQSCGINFNKFVFLEEDLHNVHSGRCAALLFSDTSFFNDVVLQPGMLVYGGYQDATDSTIRIGQPVPQYGMPIDSNPAGISFWLKMSHGQADTFSYMYLLTRWDSTAHRRDTLAFATTDIPDTHVPIDEYFQVSDGIHYLHSGHADSARIIFYGGRFGSPALATNQTWIDDIFLTYSSDSAETTTGITTTVARPAYTLSPNPATDIIHVQSYDEVKGETMELYDALGRIVYSQPLLSAMQVVDTRSLATGSYHCRIADSRGIALYYARISVVR